LFSAIDEDNTGTITPDELMRALKRTAIPPEEIDKMFRDVDQDHTGHIKYV
jgi:Ca2+-binding EF-hand superfamily protein